MMKKLLLSFALLLGLTLPLTARAQDPDPVDFNKVLKFIGPDPSDRNIWIYDLIIYMYFSEEVALNEDCQTPITLRNEDTDEVYSLREKIDKVGMPGIRISSSDLNPGAPCEVRLQFTPDMDGIGYFTEGHYNLTIPEGFFTVNGVHTSEYKQSWHKYSLPFDDFTRTPTPGSTVKENIKKVKVFFPDSELVICESAAISVKNEKGEAVEIADVMDGGQYIEITLAKPLKNGKYTVTLDKGTVMVDGIYNDDSPITWSFEVKAPYIGETNPAKGYVTLDKLRTVTITYLDDVTVTLGANPDAKLKVGSEETRYDLSIGDTPNVVRFKLQPYETDKITVVKFLVGAGSFFMDGVPNEEISINYWLQGASVDALPDAPATFDIVTPDGILLKTGATPADLRTLAPGLYIINGQKTLIH